MKGRLQPAVALSPLVSAVSSVSAWSSVSSLSSLSLVSFMVVVSLGVFVPFTSVALADDTAPAPLPRGEVIPEKALVYVLRPAAMGFAVPSYAFVDDQLVGVNRGNGYFFVHVDPGKHIFWSKQENIDALELEVEGGKTYYLRQKTLAGLLYARTAIEVLDPAKGEKVLAEDVQKHSVMTDDERKRGEEHAKKYFARAQKEVATAR